MADGTVMWILIRSVIRRSIIVALVAPKAFGSRAVEVAIHMALRTRGIEVRARERKTRTAVIKGSRSPAVGRVADRAIVIIIPGYMVGIGQTLIIALVTRPAIRRRSGKLSVHVTQGAVHADMRSRQWESREIVIEVSRVPSGRRMAAAAVVAVLPGGMIRIGGTMVIRRVAGVTRRGSHGMIESCPRPFRGGN